MNRMLSPHFHFWCIVSMMIPPYFAHLAATHLHEEMEKSRIIEEKRTEELIDYLAKNPGEDYTELWQKYKIRQLKDKNDLLGKAALRRILNIEVSTNTNVPFDPKRVFELATTLSKDKSPEAAQVLDKRQPVSPFKAAAEGIKELWLFATSSMEEQTGTRPPKVA